MAFVPDSPVEMSDGTLRCRPHNLEICGTCCYTSTRDGLEEQGEANDAEQERNGDEYPDDLVEMPDGTLHCRRHDLEMCGVCWRNFAFVGGEQEDFNWPPDSPVEMPDGTLRCRCQRHGLERCGVCCRDYTFMRDGLDEQEESNDTKQESDEEEANGTKQESDEGDDEDWRPYGEEQSKTEMNLCNVCSKECQERCSRCENVFYCSPEHSQKDWPLHKAECVPHDPKNPNRPTLLFLSIGISSNWTQPILVEIGKKMTILEAKSEEVAIRRLHKRGNRPRAVLCGGELQPKHYPRLVTRLANFIRTGGGTAIFALVFPSTMPMPEFDSLFAKLGLSGWKNGSYHRTTHMLRTISAPPDSPLGEMLNRGGNHLAKAYSMKALHIAKPGEFEAIYSPTDESSIESRVFSPTKIEDLKEAPIAFAKVGRGWVGYVGDVSNEEESRAVILAMLDLLR